MTPKENLELAMDGKKPEWTPIYWEGARIVVSMGAGNSPMLGEKEGYNKFGVHMTATENSGGMFTPTADAPHVVTDITKWQEQVTIPDAEEVDWAQDAQMSMQMMGIDREASMVDYFHGYGLFETMHMLMGMEEAAIALMEEPEASYELVGAIADYHLACAKKVEQYYQPEYYTFADDYAHLKSLFISPTTFDEIFAPHLKRIYDFVNQSSMKLKIHCCGRQELLLDRFYDLGVRRFDPGQPCNDLVAMKEKHPDIAIIGGLDIQGIVDRPGVTDEELRAEVDRCIDEYGPMGGYTIYGASVDMYNPMSYAPGGKMNTMITEACTYSRTKQF